MSVIDSELEHELAGDDVPGDDLASKMAGIERRWALRAPDGSSVVELAAISPPEGERVTVEFDVTMSEDDDAEDAWAGLCEGLIAVG